MVQKKVGTGTILWTAAPIEMERPHMSRQVVCRLIRQLINASCFTSNAPKYVEVVNWRKDDHIYLAVINQQEELPAMPMDGLWIEMEGEGKKGTLLPDGSPLQVQHSKGKTRLLLPKLELFQFIEME